VADFYKGKTQKGVGAIPSKVLPDKNIFIVLP
jgi:hypothetical protein